MGMVHRATPRILKYVSLGQHVFLSGPAGSGKTSVATKIAEALKLTLWPLSVGAQTTKTDLFGFIDGNGKYHTTPFREAFEKGGVFLLDEIDAGNPNVLVALNSALSGAPEIFFPDGLVKRHKDFRCIAAANTWGYGADRQYVGRNQLDAATLNRFLQVTFDYDEELETAIAGNARWSRRVQALRKSAFAQKSRVMITPRASINGAVLVAAGETFEEAEEATIWASIDADTKAKIMAGVR
jgi:MoxR-like ATPase